MGKFTTLPGMTTDAMSAWHKADMPVALSNVRY
jgi:hypothetical protein